MANVLLISMPFADAQYASMGLSLLKPACSRRGLPCDIEYFNIRFRSYVEAPPAYDMLADSDLLGEWVFGAELFGPSWNTHPRGSMEYLQPLVTEQASSGKYQEILRSAATLRAAAGPFLEKCLQTINWESYHVIGFTSVFSQHIASLALARKVKDRWPEKIIAFGGANCAGEMGLTLLSQFSFVDWVFSGEADLAFPTAVQRWEAGESLEGISGLAYRERGAIKEQGFAQVNRLDELPLPDFQDHFAAVNQHAPDLQGQVPVSLEFSRGCWWGARSQCIFCGLNGQILHYRSKSPHRALQEIAAITDRYGVDNVRLVDNNVAPHYFAQVLPFLPPQKLAAFFVETKSNLDREQVQRLQQAGTRRFQPGVESLDTEILQYMKKGTNKLETLQMLKWSREYGLTPVWNFLHSFPGEQDEPYQRMAALVPLITHLQPPQSLGPVALQRYSPMFENQDTWQIKKVRANQIYRCLYPFEQSVLDRLAYLFDYTTETEKPGAKAPSGHSHGQAGLIRAAGTWRELWQKTEPPLLGFVRTGHHGAIVYDTRPGAGPQQTELNHWQFMVLSACDQARSAPDIAQEIRVQTGIDYPGDAVLRDNMNSLVEAGYLVSEEDRYLSLVNDMEVLARHTRSLAAHLLVG